MIGVVDVTSTENPADGLGGDRLVAAAVDGEFAPVQQHDPVGKTHRQIQACSAATTAVRFCARRFAVSTRSIWWRMWRLEVGSSEEAGAVLLRRRPATSTRQNARVAARRRRASAIAGE